MLSGRLGLETARVPHSDRHGLLWLGRGRLFVDAGTLRFATVGFADLPPGEYDIAFQGVSMILLTPGTSVTHDALRLLARHGCGLLALGESGVRFYAAMPFGPDDSRLARRQTRLWADPDARIRVAKAMYAMRMGGETLPQGDLNALRGIEGARAKAMYKNLAQQYGVDWRGRRYDRHDPGAADHANQAINHAATAVQGAAMVATAAVGAIPQLGFIHEESGVSFCLDIADLFRDDITLPVAFRAARQLATQTWLDPERCVRRLAGETLRKKKVIAQMIDRIKELLSDADDPRSDP